MLRLKNGFLVVATAFFASNLSSPVFAEENAEIKKETPKVYLESLKENFDFSGNVKTFFSYSGIPTSNIFWAGNEFRPFYFRANGKKVNPGFNAGVKGTLNLGKTFKNNAGKNVLKVSTGLEVDLINGDFEDKAKNLFKLASAKTVLFDCLKVGYDSLFVAGAKTVMVGGMFKVNDELSLNFDIFRDPALVDLDSKTSKGLCEKNVKDGKEEFKQVFKYNSAIPGVAVHGSYSLGNLGKANLSLFGRPVVLSKEEKKDEKDNISLFGFAAKANVELHFIKDVDTLKIGGFFSAGCGDYLAKTVKAVENVGRVDDGVKAIPASFYLAGEKDDIKSVILLDSSVEYSYKVNPVNVISVSVSDLHYFGDFKDGKFYDDKKDILINNVLNLGLGYKYSVCKKADFFANLNGVYMHLAKGEKFKGDEKQSFGWGFNFGIDCKL